MEALQKTQADITQTLQAYRDLGQPLENCATEVYQLKNRDLAWSSDGTLIQALNPQVQAQRVLKNGKDILLMLGRLRAQTFADGRPKYKIAFHSSNDPQALARDLNMLHAASQTYNLPRFEVDYSALSLPNGANVKGVDGVEIEIGVATDEKSLVPIAYDMYEGIEAGQPVQLSLKTLGVHQTDAYRLNNPDEEDASGRRIWAQKRDLRCAIEKNAMTPEERVARSGIVFDDGSFLNPEIRAQDLSEGRGYKVFKINGELESPIEGHECSLYDAVKEIYELEFEEVYEAYPDWALASHAVFAAWRKNLELKAQRAQVIAEYPQQMQAGGGVEVQDDQGSMNSVLEREHTARRQDEARFEKGVKNIDTFKRRRSVGISVLVLCGGGLGALYALGQMPTSFAVFNASTMVLPMILGVISVIALGYILKIVSEPNIDKLLAADNALLEDFISHKEPTIKSAA